MSRENSKSELANEIRLRRSARSGGVEIVHISVENPTFAWTRTKPGKPCAQPASACFPTVRLPRRNFPRIKTFMKSTAASFR